LQWAALPIFAVEQQRWFGGLRQWLGVVLSAILLTMQFVPVLSKHPLTEPNPYDTPHFYLWHGMAHLGASVMLVLYVHARMRILEKRK
jgi:hypothetical protein